MPSQTTLTLLHKEAKKRVFLQGTVTHAKQLSLVTLSDTTTRMGKNGSVTYGWKDRQM